MILQAGYFIQHLYGPLGWPTTFYTTPQKSFTTWMLSSAGEIWGLVALLASWVDGKSNLYIDYICYIKQVYTYILYLFHIYIFIFHIYIYIFIKGSLDEKLPSYEVLKMLRE